MLFVMILKFGEYLAILAAAWGQSSCSPESHLVTAGQGHCYIMCAVVLISFWFFYIYICGQVRERPSKVRLW